jgi:PE-PPE domain
MHAQFTGVKMTSTRRTRCHARQWTASAGLAAAAAAVLGMGTAHADTPIDVLAAGADPNDALVLIPAENQLYADVANALYLQPNGFDGDATVFITPSVGNEVQNVVPGVQALVQTIEADYTAGDLSSTAPLYVFGYSEGAVEEGLAEQQLHDFGIPQGDLHFIMVGDSASAEGGFLNSVIDSLPESEQQPTTELFAQLGLTAPVLGATTPDNLYPTDAYSLTTDGWTDWDGGANTYGMFTDHLEYLGLTPAEIATATETTDGLTHYYTIDDTNVNDLEALYNQALLALDITPSNVSTDGSAGAAADLAASTSSAAATPDDVIGQTITGLNSGTTVLDTASTADLGTRSADLLSSQEGLASQLDPLLNQLGSLQDQLTPTDQTLLAGVDEQMVSAAQNILSADQAFVAADQAGDLSGSGFTSADFTVLGADFNFLGAFLEADGAGILADLTGGFDPSSAADLAAGLDPATVIDPSIFADLLSSIGL